MVKCKVRIIFYNILTAYVFVYKILTFANKLQICVDVKTINLQSREFCELIFNYKTLNINNMLNLYEATTSRKKTHKEVIIYV